MGNPEPLAKPKLELLERGSEDWQTARTVG